MRVLNRKYWPHQHRFIDLEKPRSIPFVEDIERWCYDNFKSGNWRNTGYYFAFKRHDDFVLFMLRWS